MVASVVVPIDNPFIMFSVIIDLPYIAHLVTGATDTPHLKISEFWASDNAAIKPP